ncbi:MAG: CsgG/HfaB family protein, partial [Treponema sp.]|nr:CsgG/HfaB family protein [Treponema sp.]
MTIIDRQNLEKILAEQTQSLSGDYSDEDYISIGKLTNARYILTGSISKISGNYMLELSVSDVESSERKASYPPRQVTFAVLEDLTAVKEASADLLGQLGVSLTAAGLTELTKAVAPIQVQAETALARGITAQKQGTEVAALSYYFQAATLDPSLLEAANRSSVLTANINSGNIAQDVRNDIQWRRDWINRLTETEKFFADLFQNTAMVYTLFYSTGIEQGAHDYENETATFNINTNLHASQLWAASVERALQTVYDGLDATKRKAAWGLGNWPRQSVSGLKPFDTMYNMFAVTIDLLNDRNQVIGIKTFVAGGAWTFNVTDRPAMGVVEDDKQTISIAGININDITDNLKIRIADVKGYSIQTVDESGKPVFTEADMESLARTQTEGQPGVLQIKEVSGEEWEFYSYFTFVKGSIVGYNNYTY